MRIQTSLLGPEKGEKTKDVVTYPYVVVKLKKTEKLKLYEAVVDALFEEQDLV